MTDLLPGVVAGLTLSHTRNGAPMPTDDSAVPNDKIQFYGVTPPQPDSTWITVYGVDGQPILTIRHDAQVVYAEGTDLDEASRIFWEALAGHARAGLAADGAA